MIGSPLPNARHEKFAQALATGMAQGPAYKKAGFQSKTNSARDTSAARLFRNVRIKARVAELQNASAEEVVEKVALTKEWVLKMLTDAAARNAGLVPVKQTIALKGGKRGAKPRVVTIETTVYDPGALNVTLKMLGQEVGLYKDGSANNAATESERAARNHEDPEIDADLARLKSARAIALGLTVVGGTDTKKEAKKA